jgi:hypothetical protein
VGAAEVDAKFTIFDLFTLKKKSLIFESSQMVVRVETVFEGCAPHGLKTAA